MDLSTHYLGLKLASPFIVGASPLCDLVDVAWRLQDAGAAAVVMRSLFGEQLEDAPPAHQSGREAPVFPAEADYPLSPVQYLRRLDELKRRLTIPVIASLNGNDLAYWRDYAKALEQSGADAIELNFYQVVTDAGVAADRIETEMLRAVGAVTAAVRIPVAVKLSPFHTAVAQLAVALELEGAAGVILFNRFYQPDIDIEQFAVQPLLHLSERSELLLRLRWLAILSPQLRGSLAAAGGIHTSEDAIKALLAGADAVQIVSVVLKEGVQIIPRLIDGLAKWMQRHGFESLDAFRGKLDLTRSGDASAFERANYLRVLQQWKR
jgi:dihydroorotate dehydrogenase (fumarate)